MMKNKYIDPMIEMITIKVEESFLTKASGNAGGLDEEVFGDSKGAKPVICIDEEDEDADDRDWGTVQW